jgi:low temperature requirement protein LtrA
MSQHEQHAPTVRWKVPMVGRSPQEPHRAATPLELFFDLVFVVAIARASSALHHGISDAHAAEALLGFVTVFFAIWWAWMNFTWFASAYDTDDVVYRLTVLVQLTGALILAAGVGLVFEGDFAIVVAGYVVMRLAQVGQWIRAARSDPRHTRTAYRYAAGIVLLQLAWIGRLWLPAALQVPSFIVLVLCELLVPIWAERFMQTTWHPSHIAERFGLFTIIVLGESILSATVAIQTVVEEQTWTMSLVGIIVGGLLIIFAMWWLYFFQPVDHLLSSFQTVFAWGYGHLLIFASAAAVGAGLAVAVDHATDHAEISAWAAGAAVAFPAALFLIGVWALHQRPRAMNLWQTIRAPIAAALILLTPFTGQAVLLTGILFALLLGSRLLDTYRTHVATTIAGAAD